MQQQWAGFETDVGRAAFPTPLLNPQAFTTSAQLQFAFWGPLFGSHVSTTIPWSVGCGGGPQVPLGHPGRGVVVVLVIAGPEGRWRCIG